MVLFGLQLLRLGVSSSLPRPTLGVVRTQMIAALSKRSRSRIVGRGFLFRLLRPPRMLTEGESVHVAVWRCAARHDQRETSDEISCLHWRQITPIAGDGCSMRRVIVTPRALRSKACADQRGCATFAPLDP